MDIDSLINASGRIFEEVMDAINTNNYDDLSKKIKQRLQPQAQTKPTSYFLKKNVNKKAGLTKMILGGIGLASCGICFLFFLLALLISITDGDLAVGIAISLWGCVVFGGLTGGSLALLLSGRKERTLADHYYEYGRLIGGAEYLSISTLADRAGIPTAVLVRELETMKARGMLPNAHMDRNKTTLMLSERSYEQYRLAEQSREERERLEKQKELQIPKQESAVMEEQSYASEAGTDVGRILDEGQRYLRNLKDLNNRIPDEDPFSDKLYRQEHIVSKIFAQLEKQPEKAPALRKFMDYYLPTTEKLLHAYVELDQQPDVGDNITNTKKEISEAIDAINDAFENLLDKMFEDIAWDISSDISVMKTMLAQDGLHEPKERSTVNE